MDGFGACGGRGAVAVGRRGRRRYGSDSTGPGRPPPVPNGSAVEALALEQPARRRQVLLSLPDSAAPGERVQESLVHAHVERRQLEPLLQMFEHLVAGRGRCEALQQDGVATAKAAPLRREPGVEARIAIELQAVEKFAAEQGRQRSQPIGRQRRESVLAGAGDLDRVDEAIRQVELDGVSAGVDPPPAGLVDDAPDLAEAPAKLAARIVRDVPQQFAELSARYGPNGQRQVGDKRARLARRRQVERHAIARDRQGSEQLQMQRRPDPRFPPPFPRRLPRSPPRVIPKVRIDGRGTP